MLIWWPLSLVKVSVGLLLAGAPSQIRVPLSEVTVMLMPRLKLSPNRIEFAK